MSGPGPENRFIGSVHRHLGPEVYHMKNHNAYVGGVADVWYSGNKGDLWVEYKFIAIPTRSYTVVDLCKHQKPLLSSLQQAWLHDRHGEGRRVGVIIGTPQGGIWLPGLEWQEPLTAEECRSRLLPRPALANLIAEYVHSPPLE